MIKKLKMLYPSVSDEVLNLVLENVQSFALDYCNLKGCPASMDTLLFKMCQEDLNKLGSEGFTNESVAGNSLSYLNDYSPLIYKRLNKHKHIRIAG